MSRKLEKNLFLLYGGEALAKVFSLLAFFRLTHVLGDGGYGLLVFPLGVYFVFNQVLDAGLAPYGAREASKHPSRTQVLAARIAWIRLVLVLASLVVLLGIALALTGKPHEVRVLLVLFGAALLPMPFVVNWAFEARNEMHVVAGSSLLRQVVFAGLVWSLVHDVSDVYWVPLCEAAGLAALALAHQRAYRRRFRAFLPLRGRRGHARVLSASLPLGASTIFSALRWYAPVLIFSATASPSEAAHLESGHRIVVSLHTFVWLYFVNLLPSMAVLAGRGDHAGWNRLAQTSLALVAWTVPPVLLVGAALAPVLLPLLYGPDFTAAVPPFRVLVWMLCAAFLSGHFRYGLIAFGRQREEMSASAVGALVSILACLALSAAGALTPVSAAVVATTAEAATLVAAGRLFRAVVGPGPWFRAVAPAFLCAVLSAGLAALLGRGSPWTAAALVLCGTAAGLALARPRLLFEALARMREGRAGEGR